MSKPDFHINAVVVFREGSEELWTVIDINQTVNPDRSVEFSYDLESVRGEILRGIPEEELLYQSAVCPGGEGGDGVYKEGPSLEYDIVKYSPCGSDGGHPHSALAKAIQGKLDNGWKPQGGVTVDNKGCFYQAITREVK